MKTRHLKHRSVRPRQPKPERAEPELLTRSLTAIPARPALALKNILVPIDFSQPSLQAARYATRFAGQFGARIHLLYVLEKPSYLTGVNGVALSIPEKDLVKRAESKLFSLAADEIEELVPVNTVVRIGKPFDQIVKVASAERIDLIIIATHGYTGLKHVLMGSTAEKVVRHAPCPVLVVRETEKEFA
jgi:universal stress protein A